MIDTLAVDDALVALIPLAVGLAAAAVAYGRWRLAPLHAGADSRSARNRTEHQVPA